MRFYPNKDKRHQQALDILYRCQESRAERATAYRNWRNVYFYGAHTGIECKDNRIKPIIDQQSAFLFAPESCSFWIDLGPAALEQWAELPADVSSQLATVTSMNQLSENKLEQILEQINFDRIDSVIDSMNDSWVDSDIDSDTGTALTDSLIEGSTIMKMVVEPYRDQAKNSIYAMQVPCEQFGVWRPDEPMLSRQQAVCHTSQLSLPEIALRIWDHPKRAEIVNGLETAQNEGISTSRVFPTSATSTSVTGSPLGVFTGRFDYVPRNGAPLFQVHELYAWDDMANDYRVFQISGSNVILETLLGGVRDSDGKLLRRGMGVRGRLPFVKICPYPLRNYFWGYSLVDGLTPLQNWYSQRLNQLDLMFAKHLSPPKAIMGVGGLDDETSNALNMEGGRAFLGQPGASVQEFPHNISPEALEIMTMIQQNFYEFASLRPSLFGKQEPGTRTEGMLSGLLRVAAAPTRKTALVVEKQIEELATLLYLYKREFQDDQLSSPDGVPFLLSEFPYEARIKVDGHSSCPLFAEDHLKMAESMWRMGVLTPSMAVDLVHPPRAGQIKFSQRKIEMAKMVAQQVVQKQQEAKRSGKQPK